MKLEKLRINRKKKIVVGVVVFLCFISAVMFTGSRAKYKVTESIPLVNGTINYKPYDFKMMAMYQANDSGGYTEIDVMPTSGYVINEEKSYCTTDNVNKDTNAKIFTNSQGQHVIENLKKNDKCYIWFEVRRLTSTERIKAMGLTSTEGATSFTGPATTDEGLMSGTDDDGITYYFRGNVTNNWVRFAGFYWRIIRINGDGSIRIIYNGTSTATTGERTQLQTSTYNPYSDNAYVGYMYGNTGSSTYAVTHANTNNSAIKGIVDNWYKTNIADKDYGNKVSQDAGFCNDRSIASSSETWWNSDTKKGHGTNATAYGPFSRIVTTSDSWNSTQTPKFGCSQSADLFTVNSSTKGNHALTYPVGLITMDEVIYGGGFGGSSNSNYYLYTNQTYWTMSPYFVASGGWANVFYVNETGYLNHSNVSGAYGVRPAINLSSDVVLTGSGTTSDPYKVV